MIKAPLWTLKEGVAVIQELEPQVRPLDFHTLLGGGVLHKGSSNKDLDIWFIPLNGYEGQRQGLYDLISVLFGPLHSIRDGPDYGPDQGPWHLRDAQYGNYLGRRVDLFIV